MQTQGEKIKQLIRRRGLKQKAFAHEIGWNETAFSKKINSGEDFSMLKIKRLAQALQVHPDFIINKEQEYYWDQPVPEWADLEQTEATALEERVKMIETVIREEDQAFRRQVLKLLGDIVEQLRNK
jgi:transcriptional regulator with XRE-family HTH domain